MTRGILACAAALTLLASASAAAPAVSRPFVLPIAADVQETSKDGRGWQETGVARMTYVQAVGQFRATMAQAGWRYLHAVALSSTHDRALLMWRKGGRELTLLLWRIDVGRTGFSWGVAKAGAKD